MKPSFSFLLGTVLFVQAAVGAISASKPIHYGVAAAGSSFNPTFSADGRYLVFVSHANNLVTNDDLGLSLDVFIHDLVNSNTVLVSVSANGFGGANVDANYPSISSNGQFIAFASRASNLVAGDTNDASDVFLRDAVNGTTRLVSVDGNGNSPFDPEPSKNVPLSGNPQISPDGRWVFFESRATNLITAVAPFGSVNIYARDTWSNVTVLVSAGATGTVGAEGLSRLGSITPDARFVAFSRTATNIITGLTNAGVSVYLRDMQSGQVVWATTNCIACDSPVIDASGRIIAYFSRATDGGGNVVENGTASVYRDDRVTGEHLHLGIATNLSNPILMSADGNVILYNQYSENGPIVYEWKPSHPFGTNGVLPGIAAALTADGRFGVIQSLNQLWRVALTNDSPYSFDLASENVDHLESAASHQFSTASISPNGALVAFDSVANDLASGDLNGMSDIFLRDLNADATELLTKEQPSKPAASAFAYSFLNLNSISADGRFIVSARYDDPSAFRDTNGWHDIFLSDAINGRSFAVSISSNIYVTNDVGGAVPEVIFIENTNAFESPIISADGSTIYATRRSPDGRQRVYRALTSNALTGAGMAVTSRGINVSENGNSYAPSTSSNGLLLVFTSTSTDLVDGASDGNSAADVFLRRMVVLTNGLLSGSNELISVSLAGTSGTGASSNAFLSPDSRWVIFDSRAGNLTTNNAGSVPNVYARDLASNVTYLVSVGPNGLSQWGYVPGSAAISGNSRYVAFSSGNIYLTVHDSLTHTSVIAAEPVARSPSLNYDGRFVAYVKRPNGVNSDQIYVRDLQETQSELVSATLAGEAGNGASSNPSLSADGRYVVFQSRASDLVANDANNATDVFVRDRMLGVTMLVSANAQGVAGTGPSSRPVMAADGRTVVFQSFANDLAGGDYNDKRDIFLLKLGGADTDGDGMDDDWEVAYFSNLSRNGSGDFDEDGATDLEEFLAGTDPANEESIFRVLTVTPAGGGSTQLIWSGNPTRNYRAEFKDDLSAANWTTVNGTISWNGSTASMTDSNAGNSAHRYYRVVRLP